MACALMNPSLHNLVEAGVIVSGPGFVRDWGEGGIRPEEKEDALIFSELAQACGLMDEEEAFWEQVDEIELSLGETASSLHAKMEEEEVFIETMDQWMNKVEDCILDTSSPGYKMMKAMGWVNNSPLGCRGEGILEPVSTMIEVRQPGDFSGLGYEGKEQIEEGEKDEKEVKIIRMEKNYFVGKCDRGGVFIPRGAMIHLKNLMGEDLLGKSFTGKLISKKGKYEWRVYSVV